VLVGCLLAAICTRQQYIQATNSSATEWTRPSILSYDAAAVFQILLALPVMRLLHISLQERPSLSVLFPVVNRSVDPAGRLHTSLLANWVYGSSRLSSAVAEAVAALGEVPPTGGLASNASE
jgi:hypothetical protein